MSSTNPLRLEKMRPHKHTKGGSSDMEGMKRDSEIVKGWGTEYVIFPTEEGLSTTNIIEKVLDAYR